MKNAVVAALCAVASFALQEHNITTGFAPDPVHPNAGLQYRRGSEQPMLSLPEYYYHGRANGWRKPNRPIDHASINYQQNRGDDGGDVRRIFPLASNPAKRAKQRAISYAKLNGLDRPTQVEVDETYGVTAKPRFPKDEREALMRNGMDYRSYRRFFPARADPSKQESMGTVRDQDSLKLRRKRIPSIRPRPMTLFPEYQYFGVQEDTFGGLIYEPLYDYYSVELNQNLTHQVFAGHDFGGHNLPNRFPKFTVFVEPAKKEKKKIAKDEILALTPATKVFMKAEEDKMFGATVVVPIEPAGRKFRSPVFLTDRSGFKDADLTPEEKAAKKAKEDAEKKEKATKKAAESKSSDKKEVKFEAEVSSEGLFVNSDLGGLNLPKRQTQFPCFNSGVKHFFEVPKDKDGKPKVVVKVPDFELHYMADPTLGEPFYEPQYAKGTKNTVAKQAQHWCYQGSDFGGHNIPFPHPEPPKPSTYYAQDSFVNVADKISHGIFSFLDDDKDFFGKGVDFGLNFEEQDKVLESISAAEKSTLFKASRSRGPGRLRQVNTRHIPDSIVASVGTKFF